MKIGIACDHRGFVLKEEIKNKWNEKNILIDYGTNNTSNVDYVDYAIKVCDALKNNQIDYGILICGTGIGMSIVANKYKGIMCAKIDNIEEAKISKTHNNVNIISFGENHTPEEAILMIKTFLYAVPCTEKRYERRIKKIKNLE